MREGGAEYRMQDPELGRAEHTQVFRLEKKHKGGVSRERATEYRERVMKWQNPRIHDCSLHLQNRIDHHSVGQPSFNCQNVLLSAVCLCL